MNLSTVTAMPELLLKNLLRVTLTYYSPTKRFGLGNEYSESQMPNSIYPVSTIVAEPVVVPVIRNTWNEERECIDAFIQYLWSEEAQSLLTKFGFRIHNQKLSRSEQSIDIQDMFMADSLDTMKNLLENVIIPVLEVEQDLTKD